MTFSLIASNPKKKELCVVTATCLVAVGQLVPLLIPNVGVIACQAKVRPSNRIKILNLIKKNYSPNKSLYTVLKKDIFKDYRQIIVMNSKGDGGVFNGSKINKVSDYYVGKNFIIAGNILK